jgi:hypothetical protein
MTTISDIGFHDGPFHILPFLAAGYREGADGAQVKSNQGNFFGCQVLGTIVVDDAEGAQVYSSYIAHNLCPDGNGYHVDPYHTTAYLGPRICAAIAAQVQQIQLNGYGAQVRSAIYNTYNLRVLCDFPSRGDGNNWTANTTEPSTTDSFDVLNLNTDFTEQFWRSATGVKTGIQLDCDTGAGNVVFLDTAALLNHNITTSAIVSLFGSNNPTHSPTGVTIPLTITEDNFIYIADNLPTAGYRYWRIVIDDTTNPANFISIGTVVFGASVVFNNECFIDRVIKSPTNYADSVFTEAFSNVQNDRGIKNRVRLTFRNIAYNGGNWDRLEDVFNYARTVLKCLWVPTPRFPLRYFTFAKLTRIPEETHNVKSEQSDYVDFVIETDESR